MKAKETQSAVNPKKKGLHSRNKHNEHYDFTALTTACPSLKSFVLKNEYGNESIDFADPEAVKELNKALLHYFYHLNYWDIPDHYLCPPIPGRADYIHHIADIIGFENKDNANPIQRKMILDVGIGANCVYPIIGHQEYGWEFVGTDIDIQALESAQKIIDENSFLKDKIKLRHQASKRAIFKNIINPTDCFDITICNPPFHSSSQEAAKGTDRKLKSLGKTTKKVLNFGGKNNELWCEGGEISFITNMIYESVHFKSQCRMFSTLVSKKENLKEIYRILKKVDATQIDTIPMQQGNKQSRIVIWSFLKNHNNK